MQQFQLAALFLRESGTEDQLGQSQNRVHRRPDLMTHRREERTFRVRRVLGGVASLRQLLGLRGHLSKRIAYLARHQL